MLGLLTASACVDEDDAFGDELGDDDEFRSYTVLDPIADAMVKENYKTTNFGSTVDLRLRKNTNNDKKSLLTFDLTGVPDSLYKAELRVCAIGTNYAGRAFEVSYIRDHSWTEGGVTWKNQPASNHQNDPRESGVMPIPGQCEWVTLSAWRVLDDLQGDGLLSLKLTRGVTNDNKSLSFAAREHADPSLRPQLKLSW